MVDVRDRGAEGLVAEHVAAGREGGHRLLDYREYLHLKVEVRRQVAPDWEVANPTKLSTGEAIGVGAALMMVVLGEWERDANLLRGDMASATSYGGALFGKQVGKMLDRHPRRWRQLARQRTHQATL